MQRKKSDWNDGNNKVNENDKHMKKKKLYKPKKDTSAFEIYLCMNMYKIMILCRSIYLKQC